MHEHGGSIPAEEKLGQPAGASSPKQVFRQTWKIDPAARAGV
jgi:hypothetical protein